VSMFLVFRIVFVLAVKFYLHASFEIDRRLVQRFCISGKGFATA